MEEGCRRVDEGLGLLRGERAGVDQRETLIDEGLQHVQGGFCVAFVDLRSCRVELGDQGIPLSPVHHAARDEGLHLGFDSLYLLHGRRRNDADRPPSGMSARTRPGSTNYRSEIIESKSLRAQVTATTRGGRTGLDHAALGWPK